MISIPFGEAAGDDPFPRPPVDKSIPDWWVAENRVLNQLADATAAPRTTPWAAAKQVAELRGADHQHANPARRSWLADLVHRYRCRRSKEAR